MGITGNWRSWEDELVGHTPTKLFCRMTGNQNQFHRMNGTPIFEYKHPSGGLAQWERTLDESAAQIVISDSFTIKRKT